MQHQPSNEHGMVHNMALTPCAYHLCINGTSRSAERLQHTVCNGSSDLVSLIFYRCKGGISKFPTNIPWCSNIRANFHQHLRMIVWRACSWEVLATEFSNATRCIGEVPALDSSSPRCGFSLACERTACTAVKLRCGHWWCSPFRGGRYESNKDGDDLR